MSDKKTNKTESKTEIKKDELAELKELLQRTQANFENYRKQQELRMQEIREMASKDLIIQLLPVLDNFELALKTNCDHTSDVIKGVELIHSQLFNLLQNVGLKIIAVKEKEPFNPYVHEALMKAESDFPENTIVEELQKGYTLNGKVIRHARVKISAGKKVNDNKK